jgi:hypothetical protein
MRETNFYTYEIRFCGHHQFFEGEHGMLLAKHRFEKLLFEVYFHARENSFKMLKIRMLKTYQTTVSQTTVSQTYA